MLFDWQRLLRPGFRPCLAALCVQCLTATVPHDTRQHSDDDRDDNNDDGDDDDDDEDLWNDDDDDDGDGRGWGSGSGSGSGSGRGPGANGEDQRPGRDKGHHGVRNKQNDTIPHGLSHQYSYSATSLLFAAVLICAPAILCVVVCRKYQRRTGYAGQWRRVMDADGPPEFEVPDFETERLTRF